MTELKCKELSSEILSSIREKGLLFTGKGNRAPSLAVVLVGDNPASLSYVKSKAKRCDELGFVHFQYSLSEDSQEKDVVSLIKSLNEDDDVDAILVQLPLPGHISAEHVISAIDPSKDVDGFSAFSLGMLTRGKPSFIPCTPLGIAMILEHWKIETRGKRVCIIGRSDIVGRPLSILLSSPPYDATVTLCHSKTENLKQITLESDIVICAVGKPDFIDSSFISDNSVVIDVGINRVEDRTSRKGYVIRGDADYQSFLKRDVMITPVPGGVGLMTVCGLMYNTLLAAERRVGYEEISH